MYIAGEYLDENSIQSVHSVFEHRPDLENWISGSDVDAKNTRVIELKNIAYPFFLLEEYRAGESRYKYVDQEALAAVAAGTEKVNDYKTIYFNLWRIEKDLFNSDFPAEPCLNGWVYHLHFMDYDFQQIDTDGIDSYWKEILTA